MRVLANAKAVVCRLEFPRASLIEEQEGTERRPEVRIGEERPHRESVAYPVAIRAALDAAELLH
jgi:hypothetical protein